MSNFHYLGVDFGTSGARAIVIDGQENVIAEIALSFDHNNPDKWAEVWQKTLFHLIAQIPQAIKQNLRAIAINGTSASVLLCDALGNPLTPPLLYNDSRGVSILEDLKKCAPPRHLVISSSSSLAKLFWWQRNCPIFSQAAYFLHQADWLAFLLHGKLGVTDYHNALKLGYDVQNLAYPDWLSELSMAGLLPQVLPPGTPVGVCTPLIAKQYQLPADCVICTGTTDSIAAFLASKVTTPGVAVTSLGSTLVLKLLSETYVENSDYGIYSHRLGNLWLTGGASNTGGAVLREFFSDEDLAWLSQEIDPNKSSLVEYYPLLRRGERFPINDPNKEPLLSPRPENSVEFLQGLLESMAKIEAKGYQLLRQLGATPLKKVYTAGGGAKNSTWLKIREKYLQVPVLVSSNVEAAYGSALLAKVQEKC